jgi:hypothetical protein
MEGGSRFPEKNFKVIFEWRFLHDLDSCSGEENGTSGYSTSKRPYANPLP